MVILDEQEWRAREAAHHARVDALTADHLARRKRGEKRAVMDFLFDYYGFSPGKMRRWHPGAGVALAGAADDPRAGWKHYGTVDAEAAASVQGITAAGAITDVHGTTNAGAVTDAHGTADAGVAAAPLVTVDTPTLLAARGSAVAFVRELLARTLERPMQTGCFGLHEWAMVYKQPGERRYAERPLRLGPTGTDEVVEASSLRCTHFDATRFFTDDALPRNIEAPTRDTMIENEQPGCVHAGMDVYRWAFKLAPAVPSELVVDTYELAVRLRTLDMQASPYDLRDLGYEPVAIETPDGKREYASRQRELGDEAQVLRHRLLAALERLGPVQRERQRVPAPA